MRRRGRRPGVAASEKQAKSQRSDRKRNTFRHVVRPALRKCWPICRMTAMAPRGRRSRDCGDPAESILMPRSGRVPRCGGSSPQNSHSRNSVVGERSGVNSAGSRTLTVARRRGPGLFAFCMADVAPPPTKRSANNGAWRHDAYDAGDAPPFKAMDAPPCAASEEERLLLTTSDQPAWRRYR